MANYKPIMLLQYHPRRRRFVPRWQSFDRWEILAVIGQSVAILLFCGLMAKACLDGFPPVAP